MLNVSQHSQENTLTGVSFLINIVVACNLSLSLFKKRFWHWCFPDSYLKFLTTTFLKREKKALLWEKNHCYKKCGSDIYRKSTYATFFCNFAKISVFEQGVSTVYSNNRYIVLSVEKKSLKVVNSTLTIGFWRSLTCQNSHVDICPLGRLDWLISMQCSHKTFHFLSVSDGPTSILSDIVITLRKSHEIIFVTYFWKTKNTCERCFWDVSETSRKRHLFWDMPETS